MKTDLVEIFQTIRASIQPFAAMGYTVHENSETGYDLYSEKNIEKDGLKVTERFFVGVYINGQVVELKLNTAESNASIPDAEQVTDEQSVLRITQLDEAKSKSLATYIDIIHTNFKEKDWI